MAKIKHLHLMGIGGTGMSAIAQLAQAAGFKVSGCDLKLQGHSVDHLKDVDLLLVSPAVFYQNNTHPEVEAARKNHILMKWQDFMGHYLHSGKKLICIAGTHGKSTTTAMAGLLLETAKFDPTVELGAIVKKWHNNVRLGHSDYFICEADEFHDNFATYHPDILILTLVEFDHPEYFGTVEKMLDSYQGLINRTKELVIYNSDSPLASKLTFPLHSLPYSLSEFPKDLNLSQAGNHNKLNALAILKLGDHLAISHEVIYSVLQNFSGLERRLDLIGSVHGLKIYDDYANHPSSFAATLSALKELYPNQKITAIIEPHTFSRLRTFLSDLPAALKNADEVIITKIYASRESDPGDFTGQDIANVIPGANYIPEFSDIINHVKSCTKSGANHVIIVMGSGNSHLLSRQILAEMN